MPGKRRKISVSSSDSDYTDTSPPPSSKKAKSSRSRKERSFRTTRSIWTSASSENWNTLVTESSLSTSSISTRPPRPRGIHALVRCATDAVGRGFKVLWEDGDMISDGEIVVGPGRRFKEDWMYVPNHLKVGVRDKIFRLWGGYLTISMIHELFSIPPRLILAGELLPAISAADYLKNLIPPERDRLQYTQLILTHVCSATDIGIAGLIYHLPNLEVINLKGCTLAGPRTVKTILERCSNLRRINLKSTKIGEKEVGMLLRKFGKQLEGLKVDTVTFENINETFDSSPYPSLTHLCLPGKLLNIPTNDFRARSRLMGQTIGYPKPRPTSESCIIQWSHFGDIFPRLTYLYLPGLLIPEDTIIDLTPHTLVKLSIGPDGPPVPIKTIIRIVETQSDSLRSIHLGNILPSGGKSPNGLDFEILGMKLKMCGKLEDFRLQADARGSKDILCDLAMARCSDLIYVPGLTGPWRRTLKRLLLAVPQPISTFSFLPIPNDDQDTWSTTMTEPSPLEQLDLPSANLGMSAMIARALTSFPNLRTLDLSGTTVTDDDMKIILDRCPLLSRINLTSCKGINVRHRRNIFKAHLNEADEL
ncbi:hypothetical protein IAR55_002949 [Kwoniella newhampshirensis]|uniref:F-box/LRR-repeat protein 15/At3g58940/PEG3-like LRR domain-containing protein n=1 Tax=Kwoniella newhampshirensis TaxID=1651941 RepID=A0AAW0Z028_9TREE